MAEQVATPTGQSLGVAASPATSQPALNLSGMLQRVGAPGVRQVVLIVAAAAALSAVIALAMWLNSAPYRPVFPGMSDRDAGEVAAALEQAGVDYQIDSVTGHVEVPADRVHEIRLMLAGQGLPRGAAENMLGQEGSMGLGSSASAETARLQRVREAEMARSIASLGSVQSARVHLAIPRQSVFIRERTPPSASVVLQLHPGRVLGSGEVEAIAHLVASGVPGLSTDRISIIDQRGRLLSSSGEEESMSSVHARLDFARRIEERYARHIEELLTPIVGVDRVRAKVTADVDFTRTEQTEEHYIPGEQVVRSEKVHLEGLPADAEGGVPGAVANEPPQAGAAGADRISTQENPEGLRSLRKHTRNFEVGKVISRTQNVPGQLRRLSVAVVIDNGKKPASGDGGTAGQAQAGGAAQAAGAQGEADTGPRMLIDEARLAELTELVKEAIGFDEERGDRVKVITSQFPGDVPEKALAWWQDPHIQAMAKLAIGVLAGLLILFLVVRPLVKSATRQSAVPKLGGPATDDVLEGEATVASAQLAASGGGGRMTGSPGAGGAGADGTLSPDQAGYEGLLLAAEKLAGEDPQRVARAIKRWLDEA